MAKAAVRVIQLPSGPLEVECRLAPTMVVFSHGFGVRRDSRGMFTDIVAALPAHVGYVLFDYDRPADGGVRATYAVEQIERLRQVYTWAKQQPGVGHVGIIAHSRGCLIASLAQIHPLPMVIMLAPPLAQGHARQYFTQKAGTERHGDDWYVPRSDGTTTIIPEGVFEEFDTIQREKEFLEYAGLQSMLTVIAGADGVLGDQDYSQLASNANITLATVPGASHDFAGEARRELIRLVQKYIKESL